MANTVDHPPHYNVGKIEVIAAIEDWQLGFCLGNVVKYVARARHKGSELEDLKKARWYLERAINKLEAEKTREAFRPVLDQIKEVAQVIATPPERPRPSSGKPGLQELMDRK